MRVSWSKSLACQAWKVDAYVQIYIYIYVRIYNYIYHILYISLPKILHESLSESYHVITTITTTSGLAKQKQHLPPKQVTFYIGSSYIFLHPKKHGKSIHPNIFQVLVSEFGSAASADPLIKPPDLGPPVMGEPSS